MIEKMSLSVLKAFKREGRRITMLTCYDYSTAVLLGQAGVDSILVGDSLAQVVLGHENTLPATMEIMLELTRAVRRGAPHVYLVGDMPFLSYKVSVEQAIVNAGRFLSEAQCDAVKVEVDHRHVETVAALSKAGIAVMAHLGYRPQSIRQIETVVETRQMERGRELIEDVDRMIEVGASSILLECVTSEVAQAVAKRTCLPVISCGSGPYCDGQVMVLHDILGLPGGKESRFSKRYGRVDQQILSSVGEYLEDVRQGRFPDAEHSYHMTAEEHKRFEAVLAERGKPERV